MRASTPRIRSHAEARSTSSAKARFATLCTCAEEVRCCSAFVTKLYDLSKIDSLPKSVLLLMLGLCMLFGCYEETLGGPPPLQCLQHTEVEPTSETVSMTSCVDT